MRHTTVGEKEHLFKETFKFHIQLKRLGKFLKADSGVAAGRQSSVLVHADRICAKSLYGLFSFTNRKLEYMIGHYMEPVTIKQHQ